MTGRPVREMHPGRATVIRVRALSVALIVPVLVTVVSVLVVPVSMVGCQHAGGRSDPAIDLSRIDADSRERIAAMADDADARGVFWLRVPPEDESQARPGPLGPDARIIGRVGGVVVLESDVAGFLEITEQPGVSAAGLLATPAGAARIDGRLRMELMGAIDAGRSGPITTICGLAGAPSDGELAAIEGAGVELVSVSGRVVTVKGTPGAIGRLSDLDFVTRLTGESMLDPDH